MTIGNNSRLAVEAIENRPSPGPGRLAAPFVTRPAEILQLTAFVNTLVEEPGMLAPRFFLASLLSEPCRPCVVVVSEGTKIRGLVYCKEREVLGMATGIVLADETLGAMVAAPATETESVMRCAVQALLKNKTALRWRVASERFPLLQSESASAHADASFVPVERHAHLKLPPTYNEFLASVSRYTRHNLCRYRRRSELAGNEFCIDLTFADFCAAAECLLPKSAHALSKLGLQRSLAMTAEMPSRLLIGLRRGSGEWMSLAGLWYTGDRALMALQMNDCSFARESVSLVLRSYLIEHLINRGIGELVFVDGVSTPLSLYVDQPEGFIAYIDSRSLPWLLVRHGCRLLAKLSPKTFANWQAWETSNGVVRAKQ
ncbi:MAG: hypothetical protein ACRD27_07790 [Terracidiphilus sp.]